MINQLKNEIFKLKRKPYVDQRVFKKFLERIESNHNLVRETNSLDHFCTFFLPINLSSCSIFLGNHIKAGGWIPPGGHININEHPLACVKREFFEELNHKLSAEKIELFNLSIIHINNPRHNCKVHYDIWYLVHTPKIDFNFDKKEFYEAGWFSLKEAFEKILYQEYKPVMKKLLKLYPYC